jgi:hypothetical protein
MLGAGTVSPLNSHGFAKFGQENFENRRIPSNDGSESSNGRASKGQIESR